MEKNCFCGTKLEYKGCCGAIHSGERKANTAEELMRSRYSAFVLASIDYILDTYSGKTRPVDQREEILHWSQSVEWLGLKVISIDKGCENDSVGWVEFKADFIEEGQKQIMHEKSFFQKENGVWVYVSGENLKNNKTDTQNLPNRNDLCFCGSGKKYKKCCLKHT